MQLASDAVAALQAAGFVGTWDTDVPAGRSVLDSGAATLLAGNPSLAGQPLSLETALGRVHPEDRDWVFGKIRHVRQTGAAKSAGSSTGASWGATNWAPCTGVAPTSTSPTSTIGRRRARTAPIRCRAASWRPRPITASRPTRRSSATGTATCRRCPACCCSGSAARSRDAGLNRKRGRPQVRHGWAGSSVRPMALAPASATAWSFSTVEPLTPMAPDITPSASTIGIPPGKVIRPSFECSIP